MSGAAAPRPAAAAGRSAGLTLAVLCATVALSGFDRLLIAPLLMAIARGLAASAGAVALVATVHFLCYGIAQVGHGWLSDRIGRVGALRVALVGVGAGNALAAAAPSLGLLLLARAIVGACSAGLVPGALVLLADEDAGPSRARRQAALIAALGAGTALTALLGLAARGDSWRVAFGLTAAVALTLIPLLPPIPSPRPGPRAGSLRRPLALRRVRFLALVAVPEGAAVFGFVVFFAPALQRAGSSAATAALSIGALGIGMLAGGLIVRRITGVLSDARLILAGATLLTAGYLLAGDVALAPILLAALLAGVGQSALHSTLQRWATEAAPHARGLSTALFATGAFVGAGLAALAGALVPHHFVALFLAGAVSATIAGVLAANHEQNRTALSTAGLGAST